MLDYHTPHLPLPSRGLRKGGTDSLDVCRCCVAALLELKGYLDPAGNVLKDWAPTQVAPESRVAVTSHCTWTYVACDDNNNVIRCVQLELPVGVSWQ